MPKPEKKIFCLLHDREIAEEECDFQSLNLVCNQCPHKSTQPVVAGNIGDLNDIFGKMIEEFSQDPKAVKAVCNLPDLTQIWGKIDNSPPDAVPDRIFLELVKENWELLYSKLGRAKIAAWQEQKDGSDPQKSEKATDNFRDLGAALAFKGWQRPHTPYVAVAHYRHTILTFLKDNNFAKLSSIQKEELLRANFADEDIGKLSDYQPPSNAGWIADCLTAIALDLTPGTVETYRKKCKKVISPNGNAVFVLTPPKK